MFTQSTIELNFAPENAFVIPALDVEEFLASRLWESKPRTEYSKILLESIRFLSLAQIGGSLVKRTVEEGIVSGNVTAIRAYRLILNAYRQYSNNPGDFETVLEQALKVLTKINSSKGCEEIEMNPTDLATTRELFHSLSSVPNSIPKLII